MGPPENPPAISENAHITAALSAIRLMNDFPAEFNLYVLSLLSNDGFTIGPHRKEPLYYIENSDSKADNEIVTFHTSTVKGEGFIARSKLDDDTSTRKRYRLELASGLGNDFPGSSFGLGVVAGESLRNEVWRFSAETEDGAGQLETFEWRHVRARRGTGYELVGGGVEKPLMATFVPSKTNTWYKRMTFKIVGRGLSDRYDTRWRVLVFIAAITIWRRDLRMGADEAASD